MSNYLLYNLCLRTTSNTQFKGLYRQLSERRSQKCEVSCFCLICSTLFLRDTCLSKENPCSFGGIYLLENFVNRQHMFFVGNMTVSWCYFDGSMHVLFRGSVLNILILHLARLCNYLVSLYCFCRVIGFLFIYNGLCMCTFPMWT